MLEKIIIGTAQLGLPYGINNSFGQPTSTQAHSLLDSAYSHGIRCIDTAEAYGNAQNIIGDFHKQHPEKNFKVITKCKTSQVIASGKHFEQQLLNNFEILQIEILQAYLFHSFDQYQNFAFWNILRALQNKGKLKKIGVSVYTNEQAEYTAKDERVQLVQLPFNLLDNMKQRENVLIQLKEGKKEVHTRSVFLQGLFYKDREKLGKLNPLKRSLEELDKLAISTDLDIGTLALAYALHQPLIDKVLIGVETEEQLLQNIQRLNSLIGIPQSVYADINKVVADDILLLNPTSW